MVVYFSLDTTPNIVKQPVINARVAQQSEQLLQKLKFTLKNAETLKQGNISISEPELAGLFALVHRSYPQIFTQAYLSENKLTLKVTFKTPLPIERNVINGSIVILPSVNGLQLGQLSVGQINVSAQHLLRLLIWLIDHKLDQNYGTQLLAVIKQININAHEVMLNFALPADFSLNDINKRSRLLEIRDQLQWFGNSDKIRFYYNKLLKFTQNGQINTTDFTHYVAFMLQQAAVQTESDNTVLATEENKSALLALAIYFGSKKFELLVGDISNLSAKEQELKNLLANTVSLGGRNDLQKHYIYSVALTIFSDVPMSSTVGEIKEFLDSNTGGSGFSFVDMLADKAGTKLAQLAITNENSARFVQQYFSQVENQPFIILPDWQGLPEGLSEQEFNQRFGDVHSQRYKEYMNILTERIESLPLYQYPDN
jgi:hypothetical protein